MEQQNVDNELNIELKEDVALGVYSNLAVITHSVSEFIIDFVSMLPAMSKAPVVSRVILTPENAKRLMSALQENVLKYETAHGIIKVDDGGLPPLPMGFGGRTAQA
ncbi:MAG: DUF3467 domain-containing protein [Prevotellaceae bacterium]|jgi:hypothetical protein|nr:DUF3467 domain-containing protein [Prevotellaceae bacterium]